MDFCFIGYVGSKLLNYVQITCEFRRNERVMAVCGEISLSDCYFVKNGPTNGSNPPDLLADLENTWWSKKSNNRRITFVSKESCAPTYHGACGIVLYFIPLLRVWYQLALRVRCCVSALSVSNTHTYLVFAPWRSWL